MAKILSFTKRYRIALTRLIIGGMVLLLVVSSPVWRPGPVLGGIIEIAAFILILTATFGRLWALSYISGHKTIDLITQGPYSIMRNPLYFFSLCGALGICILSRSLLVSATVLLAFAVYYPLVIRAEERNLKSFFGDDFSTYRLKVPAFIPRFSLFQEPGEYLVNARLFRRAVLSVMWFPLAFILIQFLWHLKEAGVLPVLLSIP